jgi:hypothetical protein
VRNVCVLLVAVSCVGCYPAANLTSYPRYVCPGATVDVSWTVKGDATISVRPAPVGDAVPEGKVADTGSFAMHPRQPTTVKVTATRLWWPPTAAQDDIQMGGEVKALAASLGDDSGDPGCDASHAWVTARAAGFDGALTVDTVRAARELEISHAGKTVALQPGAASNVFQGTPLGGDWVLKAKLAAGEVCGTPSLPRTLAVDVATACEAMR